jgi:hypothetical protein
MLGVVRTTLKALGSYNLRVGGITADWVNYDMHSPCKPPMNDISLPQLAAGYRDQPFWPTYERNLSSCEFVALLNIVKQSNGSLIFDLNELHGRNCHFENTSRCSGYWHDDNLYEFLSYVQSENLLDGVNFLGWELGNELTRSQHITMEQNIQDSLKLAQIVQVCL